VSIRDGGERDALVEITDAGALKPLDEHAMLRLQARAGRFQLVSGPRHYVVLRQQASMSEHAVPPRACMLSGEIHSAGTLCDIMSFVGQTGWRGEFMVEEPGASRSLFFHGGSVAGARSNVVAERLGEVLYRHGVLTREQVVACGDVVVDGGMRFGEAAVKLGYVTRETLFGLMSRQTEEIFYGAMRVASGMFYFLEGFDDSELAARQKLGVSALVREGIRRMHETRYFRARIPSEMHIPARVAGAPAPQPDPLGVYAAIDGKRPLTEICRVVGAGEFEVTRAIFQLTQVGVVIVKPPHLGPKAIVDVYNEALALILRELDAIDQGDAVRTALAQFARDTRVYAALFDGAGPADDGRLDGERLAANIARLGPLPGVAETFADVAEAEDRLSEWLFEYASYALFLARPHLQRYEKARVSGPRLSARVAAILEHIAPKSVREPWKSE
jgi:hypothetical protein